MAAKQLCVCIIRLQHSTTYVDAAHCYIRSIVDCQSVIVVSPAKTVEPIEMTFGTRFQVGPRNHILDVDPDPPWQWSIVRGKQQSIVEYRDAVLSAWQKRLNRPRGHLVFGLWFTKGTVYYMGSKSRHAEVQFLVERTCPANACPTILPWAVQKWLNWSRCHLGCGLGWAQGSMY